MKKFASLLFIMSVIAVTRLTAANAPVTMAGNVPNAVPGTPSVAIPVTVTGFTNIGQFTLTLSFDTIFVRCISKTANPSLPGMNITINRSADNSIVNLLFTWTGASNVSLADNSTIADLVFSYVSGTGLLTWEHSTGTGCQYSGYIGGILTTLSDSPKYAFYKNGGISNRGAPVVTAPVITVTSTGSLPVPVTVYNFTTITSLTLNLEYDPAIMTYVNFTKNSAFGSNFQVGSVNGSGGKKLMVITWFGNSTTLANGATLCTLNFNYTAANSTGTTLIWFDNVPSCQYLDNTGATLIDLPKSTYYNDGSAAPPLVSVSVSPSVNPVCSGTSVTFTAIPVNGGSTPAYQWKVNGSNAGTNIPTFSYIPANNDAVTCVLTSSLSFSGGNPATSNAITMNVLPVTVANFSADKLNPLKTDTVLLSDLSTGSPTSWSWSFDRPAVIFLNGTTAGSQNPQVKFTDGGLYTVTLIAGNSCGNDPEIKTDYIRAGAHGLWSGVSSTDWYTLSNWDNYLVPDGATNVIIPPAAPNWPVFDGDLILGVHCGNLTLSGSTSRMTVNGNLTLP